MRYRHRFEGEQRVDHLDRDLINSTTPCYKTSTIEVDVDINIIQRYLPEIVSVLIVRRCGLVATCVKLLETQ